MTRLRLLVLMILVMMVASLPIATSAYADSSDAADGIADWAYYWCQYYGWC